MTWTMWPQGFVSIVEKPSDVGKGTLTVRARDKKSLEAFAVMAGRTGFKAKFAMETDYPYRTVATHAEVDAFYLKVREQTTYSNFKTEAQRVRGKQFAGALSSVWNAMLKLEDKATRKLVGQRWGSASKGEAKGGGYGSLFYTPGYPVAEVLDADDWKAILDDDDGSGDAAEFERLCDLVASAGVRALTDAEYAFYEEYDAR